MACFPAGWQGSCAEAVARSSRVIRLTTDATEMTTDATKMVTAVEYQAGCLFRQGCLPFQLELGDGAVEHWDHEDGDDG